MNNKINFLWIAAIAASSLCFFMNFYHQFSDYSRVTAWGIPSAILTLALLKLEKADKIKFSPLTLWVGSISFSIYLIHLNVINAIVPLFSKIAPHTSTNNIGAGLTIFFISLIVTITISSFTYKYIELAIASRIKKMDAC